MKIFIPIIVLFVLTSCGSSKKADDTAHEPLTHQNISDFVSEEGFTYMEIVRMENAKPCDFILSDRKGNLYEPKIGLEDLKDVSTPHILVKFETLPSSEAQCTGTTAIDLIEMKLLD